MDPNPYFKLERADAQTGTKLTTLYNKAMMVVGTLEQVLGPRAMLDRALSVSPHILRQYIVRLVAQLVPVPSSHRQDCPNYIPG